MDGKQRVRINYKQVTQGWRVDEITVETECDLLITSQDIAAHLRLLAKEQRRSGEELVAEWNGDKYDKALAAAEKES